jgi:hypothetical protein
MSGGEVGDFGRGLFGGRVANTPVRKRSREKRREREGGKQ